MGNKDADLKIGADTSEAEAEFDKMANAAMTSGQRIQSVFREAGVQMAQSMVAAVDAVNSEFNKLKSVVGDLQGAMAAVGAVLAGGAAFKAMVDESAKVTKEAVAMGKAMGMTATEASVFNVALDQAHVSSETLLAANDKMTKTLRTNEQAFTDLGVTTRDANGNFRSSKDIMLDVNERLLSFKEGIDRNIEGQKIYGKGWSEVQGVLKLTKEGMAEAQAKAESLGLVIGQENVDASKHYKDAMSEVGLVLSALKKAVGDALIPVLTQLGEWFADIGPAAVLIIKGAIGELVTLWYGLKMAVEIVYEVIRLTLENLVVKVIAFATAAARALTLDWAGAQAAWQAGTEQIEDNLDASWARIVKKAEDNQQKIFNLFANPTATKSKGGGENSDGGGKDKPEKKAHSRMGGWESQLTEAKAYFQKVYDLREYSKQQELEYWQSILANVHLSQEEKIAVTKKAAEVELEILKKKAQQAKGLAQEEIEFRAKTANDEVAMEEQAAQQRLALGQITQAQFITLQQQFEDKRTDIQVEAQAARISAMLGDPNYDPVALQKLLDQMLEIQRKHTLEVGKLNGAMAIEQKKSIDTILAPISSAFDTSVKGMILGTTTLQKALQNIWTSIAGEFANAAVKMAADWASMEYQKILATQAGVDARSAAESEGAAVGLATQAGSAVKAIMNYAAETFAGVWAALSGIPYVGPAMAAAEAPVAMGVVAGLASSISASGGYDIPASVNPLVQTHAREMILPEKYADVIRGMAGGGGSGGDVHLHVHTQSVSDFKNFLKTNSHTLAPGLKALARNFVSVKP